MNAKGRNFPAWQINHSLLMIISNDDNVTIGGVASKKVHPGS